VLDGLRPDYVTPELMPNLHALAERGVFFEDHHSVFPTVTRVNAASIATGCYPAKHGLLANAVYFPQVSAAGLNTSDYRNLEKIDEATGGQLLTAPSLGEILEGAGKRLLVVSSGSPGAAMLLNRKASGAGIVNIGLIRPESLREPVLAALGAVPEDGMPNTQQNRWAVDAYLKLGLEQMKPDATVMWLSDPDHTAHTHGMGAPQTIAALKNVDGEIGRIVAALENSGRARNTNIIVASDHGFSTHKGSGDLVKLLVDRGLKASATSDDVVIVQGQIYVKDRDREKIRRIAELLLDQEWIGAVFTQTPRPGHPEGFVPGTLSFESISWNHDRRADVLAVANWSDEANEHGYKGATRQSGVAGHGTSSPFDVRATLIAAGPAFKRDARSSAPTANVDIAPTVLHLLGVEPPKQMDGRVLREALRRGPDPKSVKIARRMYYSDRSDGLRAELSESSVGRTVYMDFTRINRPAR
jgi:arylsulfatase A-like enzyme